MTGGLISGGSTSDSLTIAVAALNVTPKMIPLAFLLLFAFLLLLFLLLLVLPSLDLFIVCTKHFWCASKTKGDHSIQKLHMPHATHSLQRRLYLVDYLLHLHGVVTDRLELIRLSLLDLKHDGRRHHEGRWREG